MNRVVIKSIQSLQYINISNRYYLRHFEVSTIWITGVTIIEWQSPHVQKNIILTVIFIKWPRYFFEIYAMSVSKANNDVFENVYLVSYLIGFNDPLFVYVCSCYPNYTRQVDTQRIKQGWRAIHPHKHAAPYIVLGLYATPYDVAWWM